MGNRTIRTGFQGSFKGLTKYYTDVSYSWYSHDDDAYSAPYNSECLKMPMVYLEMFS